MAVQFSLHFLVFCCVLRNLSIYDLDCFYKYSNVLDANFGSSFGFFKYSKVFSSVCTFLPETDVSFRKITLARDQLFQEYGGARPFSRA